MCCEQCQEDMDSMFGLGPSCPHFLIVEFSLDPTSAKDMLHFAGDGSSPDEDRQTLLSWPLEVYVQTLASVHAIQLCDDCIDAQQEQRTRIRFDFDDRRKSLWAERRANRSLFMYMLCCAAKASGCDLPRDLVRHISDAAWPLPQRP